MPRRQKLLLRWGLKVLTSPAQIDKDGAEPERVKQELSELGLLPEEWGGQTSVVPVRPFNPKRHTRFEFNQTQIPPTAIVHCLTPVASHTGVLLLRAAAAQNSSGSR